jgi:hypothetical protein
LAGAEITVNGARFTAYRAAIVVLYRDCDRDCQILRRSRRHRLACRCNDSGLGHFPIRLGQSSRIVRSIGPDQPRCKLRVPLLERSWNGFLAVIQEICCHAKNIPPRRLINYLDGKLPTPAPQDHQRAPSVRWRAGRRANAPAKLRRHHEAALCDVCLANVEMKEAANRGDLFLRDGGVFFQCVHMLTQ